MRQKVLIYFLFLIFRCKEVSQNDYDAYVIKECFNFGEKSKGYDEGSVSAVFNLEGNSFFDLPFPIDLMRDGDGGISLKNFPNPSNITLLEKYIKLAEEVLDGFSTNPVIYFKFDGGINEENLPTIYESIKIESKVQLIDIDPNSPQYGKRFPLEFKFNKKEGAYIPANTLMIHPLFGFPLRGGTKYALVILRNLEGYDKKNLNVSKNFEKFTVQNVCSKENFFFLLFDFLIKEAKINLEDIAIATIWTTENPVKELKIFREFIHNKISIPPINELKFEKSKEEYHIFTGRIDMPVFLKGEPPYIEGGDFEFKEDGSPIVQRWEKVRFAITLPVGFSEESFPIIIQSHGTGGNYKSFINNGKYKIANELSRQGLACIGVDQPLHGDRISPPLNSKELVLYSFNFLNPVAGRNILRQSVIESIYLLKIFKNGFYIPKNISPTGKEIRFSKDNIGFLGHSHGGIAGAMLLGIEKEIKGGVLSGAGGGLSLTIIQRKDIVDIEEVVKTIFSIPENEEISIFHPVINLVQMLSDVTDPINYSPLYYSEGYAPSVLITEGLKDEQTPPQTTESLALAGLIPPMEPVFTKILGLEIAGLKPLSPPVSNNIKTPNGKNATASLVQFPLHDHFAIFQNKFASSLYSNFLKTLIFGKNAVIN